MKYMALSLARSQTNHKTIELIRGKETEVTWERAHWLERGVVSSLEEAKSKFGGSPVLEEIQGVH